MRLLRCFLLMFVVPVAGWAQQPVSVAGVPWILARIEMDTRVDYGRRALDGTTMLTFRNASRSAANRVPLLLNRLMSVASVSDGKGAKLNYQQNIVQFRDDSSMQVRAIDVALGRPVMPGDSTTIVVRAGGVLVGYTETGSLYIRDAVSRDFTILRTDAFAFPTLGVPSWNAMRLVMVEPFAFDVRIAVPAGMTVAVAGKLIDTARTKANPDSIITWHVRSGEPVPFLNIAIAPYDVIADDRTRIYYFRADSSGARMLHRAVLAAIDRLTGVYGNVALSDPLVVSEIPEGFGSQASLTGGIIQTADAFRNRRELRQVYHELSHLWQPPDLDQRSSRWNEGFATFMQWRLAEQLDGAAERATQMERAYSALRTRCNGPCVTTPLSQYGERGLTDLSYPVGMLMFEALFSVLGEDRFDATYAKFLRLHRETGARLTDLITTFVASDARTERVFSEWATSTVWFQRLRGGETFAAVVASYR